MAAATPRPAPAGALDVQDFSLVLGGPLFQLLRRARLSDGTLGLVRRRILSAAMIMWAPPLVLAALHGVLIGPGLRMPFLDDIGFHLRFLVVVPLLLIAELVVHRRMQPIVNEFRVRSLIRTDQLGRFADAVSEAVRWRNSITAEVVEVALVYVAGGFFTWRRYANFGAGAWYASPSGEHGLSFAGLWLVFVSLPLLQFLLLRWYFRLFVWAKFLWRVSHLDLDLNVIHPDRAGGLGFLGEALSAFVPIAAAHGVLFAGMLADRIFYAGAKLTEFRVEMFGAAIFLAVVFAGPLALFGPLLLGVRRVGLREYGALAQDYVRAFRDKWLGGAPGEEPLLGSSDIQSLADLSNSFAGAEQMRLAPIRWKDLAYFIAAFFAPILPLVFTMISPSVLLKQLVALAF